MSLKVGVLGAGFLGKIHLKLLKYSPKYDLIGFYDPDRKAAHQVSHEFGYLVFESIDQLLKYVEVLVIVTPTLSHYKCAIDAIKAGKHIFIEKPLCNSIAEADEILEMLDKHNVKGQVGHVERFNPAYLAVEKHIKNPLFIESHRLSWYNSRGTDVPVILDLMIHDIDIILSTVKSSIKSISSNGAAIISNTPDIANARIEFENGSVANLTTNRISIKSMRKTRFFLENAYISVDFLEKKSKIIQMKDAKTPPDPYAMLLENSEGILKEIVIDEPKVEQNNAILDELESFADSISQNKPVKVSIEEGKRALEVALQIINGL